MRYDLGCATVLTAFAHTLHPPWTALAQRMEAHGSREPLDLRRVGLTAAFGGAVVGPMGHVWYGLLDKLVLRMGLTSAFQAMLFKVSGRGG